MKPVFHVSLHEDNNVYVEKDRKDFKKEEKTCLVGNKTEQRKTENTHADISPSHFETENNNKKKNHFEKDDFQRYRGNDSLVIQVVNNPINLNIQNTVKLIKPKPFSDIKIELKSITDYPNQQTLQKINESSQEKQALVLKKKKLNYREDTETRLKANREDKPMIVCGRSITTTSKLLKMAQNHLQKKTLIYLANPEKINPVVHLPKMEPFGHYAWPPEADGNNPSYIFFSPFPVSLLLSLSPQFIALIWPFRKLHSNYSYSQHFFQPLVPRSTDTTTLATMMLNTTKECPKSEPNCMQPIIEEKRKTPLFWNAHPNKLQNLDMDSSAKLPGPECRECYLRLKELSFVSACRSWKSHRLEGLDLASKTNATSATLSPYLRRGKCNLTVGETMITSGNLISEEESATELLERLHHEGHTRNRNTG
ncbi:hypothetical protein CAEBREN_10752 [Caenorhabditis brenneri]|uniref:Uncharacterized protein n=1 Tax=Caenorhabditis brenneri TaxID=135651 RepID=G0P1K4_CAEBE|nr:hypothetical protein CAEBREN_10752 [Caenorhabditis brenneri]